MMSIIEGEAEIKVRQIYRKLFHVFMTRSHQNFFFVFGELLSSLIAVISSCTCVTIPLSLFSFSAVSLLKNLSETLLALLEA